MEELELQDRPGLFSRVFGFLKRTDENDEGEAMVSPESPASSTYQLRSAYRYHVTVRSEIVSFDDAYAAANGLKRGEQQILNLANTDAALRQKIVDFMSGVAFAQDANWELVGEHIYLVAPTSAYVEVASPAPKMTPGRN